MKPKNLTRIFVFAILLILAIQFVFAIGISPSRKFIDYSPGLKIKVPITIINAENKDMRVLVYAQGELASYINLNETLMPISKNESKKEFFLDIQLPMEMEKAGNVVAQLFALEFPTEEEIESGSKVISAKTAVISQIIVRVPYPGKYAEAGLYVEESEVGQITKFVIPVMNLGTDPIVRAKADIIIYSPTNEKIAELSTDEIPIESKKQADLKVEWLANVNPGVYYAVAILDYDGKKLRLEKTFRAGKLMLELLGVDVGDFTLGDVAEFNIKLYNNWNEILNDVFAEMTVKDLEDRTYTMFKSSEKDIGPLSTETLQTYWNTKGISVGPYKIDLIVHYADQTFERTFDIQVYPDEINVDALTARAITQDNRLNRETIIFIVLIALVVINVLWFIIFSKKLKKIPEVKKKEEVEISEPVEKEDEESNKEFET